LFAPLFGCARRVRRPPRPIPARLRSCLGIFVWVATVTFGLPACADVDSPVGTSGITSVALPDHVELEIGEARQISAEVVAENGAEAGVTWRSSNPAVAVVAGQTTGGQVAELTALLVGTTTIRATSVRDTSKFAEAQVIVGPANVAVVTLTPAAPDVIKGQTLALTAAAHTPHGIAVTGRPVVWATSNPSVAAISDQGVVTGVGYGTATLTATIEGVSGTTVATVKSGPATQLMIGPPNPQISRGGTVRLTLDVRDAFGNEVDLAGKTVAWTSSAPTVATVGSDGIVAGVSPGLATIIASVDGKSASAIVTVQDAPPATIAVAPGVRSVEQGKTVKLFAVIKDASGNLLSLNPTWRSLDPQIASVSTDGVVAGVAASGGPARVVASIATSATTTLADTVLVTVTPAAVATIQVGLETASIEVGEQTQATATLRSDAGQVLTGRTVTWSSSAPNVATVSTAGVVTGVGAGSATITAQREGKTGSVTVQVVAGAPDRVDVWPTAMYVAVGETETLIASVRDRRGGLINGCSIVWGSANPAIATVSAGVVTGVAVGSVSITATCLTVKASANVYVTQGPRVSIAGMFVAGTSTPANIASMSGPVDVVASFAPAGLTPSTVEVLVDGQVDNLVSASSPGCPTACKIQIYTHGYDDKGVPHYLNGNHTISVRLNVYASGAVTASQAVVFNNHDGFATALTPNGIGANATPGILWYGGPNGGVTAEVTPLIYSARKSVSSVSVRIGSGPSLTDATPPFIISFNATNYAGYTSNLSGDALTIAASTFADGSAGPTSVNSTLTIPTVRLDFAPPTPPVTTVMPLWVNRTYVFYSNVTPGIDAGVGAVVTRIGVKTGSLPPGCSDVGLTNVGIGSELAETSVSDVYRGRAISLDLLQNRSCTDLRPAGLLGGQFGADFTPPTLTISLGPTDGLISSTTTPDFLLNPSDNASGFSTSPPFRVSITRTIFGTTSCFFGSGPGCSPADQSFGFRSSDGLTGFYNATIQVTDQANNLSVPVKRSYLIDNSPPLVFIESVPEYLNSRQPTRFNYYAEDNVGLTYAFAGLKYGPHTIWSELGAIGPPWGFGPPFVNAVQSREALIGLVPRCVNSAKPSVALVRIFDLAGLSSTGTRDLQSDLVEPCGAFEQPAGTTFSSSVTSAPASVSRASGTVTLSIAIDVPGNSTARPFLDIVFYYFDGTGFRPIAVGTQSVASTAGNTTWRYSAVWDPGPSIPTGNIPVSVVITDWDRDAVSIPGVVNVTP
jgi:uncharacterized protein YjdB